MATHNVEYPEELQFILEEILGSKEVYFQPPADQIMKYPAIVYQLDNIKTLYASNLPYRHSKAYMITYISRMPDQYVPDKIGSLQGSSFSRFYVSDNLNHYAYRVYFDAQPNNQQQGGNY